MPVYSIMKSNLGRRIVLLVSLSMLLILTALAVSGWLAVRESSDRVFHERQGLAQATGKYLDYILRQNLERLDSVRFAPGVNIEDSDLGPEKTALHSTYLASIFDDGVFITNQQGMALWIEPPRPDFVGTNIAAYLPIGQSLTTGRPVISNLITTGPGNKPVLFILTPLRNQEGKLVGLVGGQIDPRGRSLRDFTQPVELGQTSYIDIIDSNGIVLASSDSQRVTGSAQKIAGEAEVSVLAPLTIAPWSVAIRQSEAEALAPVQTMEQRFFVFGLSSLLLALFLSWGMAQSVIRPIARLNTATQNITRGDLSQPIPQLGNDEIGELSRSFDAMRAALKKSVDHIQELNRELEAKVQQRTQQLAASYQEIERKEAARGDLLRKVLTVQEEERKRIARELHDETSQLLAGLAMRLEATTALPDAAAGKIKGMLADIKSLTVRTIDSVHKIIFDLRPSVLDDLGLLSAIRWFAENRLAEAGIKPRTEVTGEERKLPPQVEIAVFRVVQEAITNIFKHAEAQNVIVSVEFKDSALGIEIEDDGKGFDVSAVSRRADKTEGLGLAGMEERVTLIGGKLNIESQPGRGTHITVAVPVS